MYFEEILRERPAPSIPGRVKRHPAQEASQNLIEFTGVNRSKLAAKLRLFKAEIAQAVIEVFYRRHPSWRALLGEEATDATREQLTLHVDMVAAAIDVGVPETFARYASWLGRVSRARGLAAWLVAEHFDDLAADLRNRLSPAEHRLACEFTNAASAAVHSPVAGEAAAATPLPGVLAQERSRFLQAVLEGRRESAVRIARQVLRAGYPPESVYIELCQHALYEAGYLWEGNRLAIAQEHLATGVVQHVMAQVQTLTSLRGRRRGPKLGRAILSGVEGERHQLGAQMVADLLERDGWDVWFLGTDLPVESIVEAVELRRPDVLGLSASMLWSLPRARTVLRAVHVALGSAAPRIVLGGSAFQGLPGMGESWGADAVALDACAALECFARFQPAPNTKPAVFRWPWAFRR
ncbi:MAG TPA: cobalamin-dependent protein [Chthoniobacterales bacterium]